MNPATMEATSLKEVGDPRKNKYCATIETRSFDFDWLSWTIKSFDTFLLNKSVFDHSLISSATSHNEV